MGEASVEALTQRPPVLETAEPVHPLVPLNLPEPFNDIARHCLMKDPASRWTVAEITDRLKGRSPVSQVPQPAVSQTRTLIQPKPVTDRPEEADSKRNH